MVAAIAGSFIGLVLGGVLAPDRVEALFLVSVPFGLFGTVWAPQGWSAAMPDPGPDRLAGEPHVRRVGLIALLVGITYGILPRRSHDGVDAPSVIRVDRRRRALARGVHGHRDAGRAADVPAAAVPDPGVHRRQHRRPVSALARGGLMFMLIIWLQGIWLPEHGYSFPRRAVGRHLHAAAVSRGS